VQKKKNRKTLCGQNVDFFFVLEVAAQKLSTGFEKVKVIDNRVEAFMEYKNCKLEHGIRCTGQDCWHLRTLPMQV
jgi:hypothetical protein